MNARSDRPGFRLLLLFGLLLLASAEVAAQQAQPTAVGADALWLKAERDGTMLRAKIAGDKMLDGQDRPVAQGVYVLMADVAPAGGRGRALGKRTKFFIGARGVIERTITAAPAPGSRDSRRP